MAKTKPFHSSHEAVYHDNTECEAGRKIVATRIDGLGNKKHCPECGKLNAAGK